MYDILNVRIKTYKERTGQTVISVIYHFSEDLKPRKREKRKSSSSSKVYHAVNMQFGKNNKIIGQRVKSYSSESNERSSKRKRKHKTRTRDKTGQCMFCMMRTMYVLYDEDNVCFV